MSDRARHDHSMRVISHALQCIARAQRDFVRVIQN
jgi:hypothetical protein